MALGALIIKQRTGHSDDETVNDILENPYMQFLIGLHEFVTEAPFSQSTMTSFRKCITKEMIDEINDNLFRPTKKDDDETPPKNDNDEKPSTEDMPKNKGSLLLDATCAPANMTYPTDISSKFNKSEKTHQLEMPLRASLEKEKPSTD